MPAILRILLVVFLCYMALVLFVFFFQSRMVYYPTESISFVPSDMGLPYKEVMLRTTDGLLISGWLVGDHEDRDVVLFCHGNGGNISHRMDSFLIFHHLGLKTFIFDYRGYGKSRGKPSEKGTYLDIETAWQYLTEKEKIPPQRIILFGRSLGGAVASYLAAEKKIKAKALILESTFTSVPDLGTSLYPFLPVRLLSRFKYNTKALLKKITLPVLVVHSPNDEIIPFSHGKALFAAANEPKQFLEISGTHNDGFLNSRKTYIHGLKKFLKGIKIRTSESETLKNSGH